MASNTIVVYGASFWGESPARRHKRAAEAVAKALGEKRTTSDIFDDAIEEAEKRLNGVELVFERNAAFRSFVVTAQCPHCGRRETTSDITDTAIEDVVSEALAGVLCQGVSNILPGCLAKTCGDPLDRKVDGLTVRECLWRFMSRMRSDKRCDLPQLTLTPAQLTAARLAWSAELRRKQEEQREGERCQVVVDRQDEP